MDDESLVYYMNQKYAQMLHKIIYKPACFLVKMAIDKFIPKQQQQQLLLLQQQQQHLKDKILMLYSALFILTKPSL